MMVSRANNLTRPYNSPLLASYPSEAKEKADKGLTFWTIFRESYMGFGYNKNQVSPDAVPKGFDGLLHPQLKGKMAHHAQRKLGAHDRRDDQDQRRSLRQKTQSAGDSEFTR